MSDHPIPLVLLAVQGLEHSHTFKHARSRAASVAGFNGGRSCMHSDNDDESTSSEQEDLPDPNQEEAREESLNSSSFKAR